MSLPSTENQQAFDDEISVYEFLVSLKYWLSLIVKNWKLFSICIFLSLSVLLFWRSQQLPSYNAEMTLMLSDDGGSSLSGLSGVLGQFGLPVSTGKYNIDKLIEIARSRIIIEDVLLQKVNIDKNIDLIGNHIIKNYKLDEKWMQDEVEGNHFIMKDTSDSSSKNDKFIIKSLYNLVVGSDKKAGLLKTDYGRDNYIMTFEFTSLSEVLSILFLNRHFESLKEFYIDKSTEKQQKTYDLIKDKRDSILYNLQSTEQKIASLKDNNLGSFRNSTSVRLSELNTQSLVLKAAYAKVEENLALAHLALEDRTPLIQLIDKPIGPIQPSQGSILKTVLWSFLIGVFVSFFLLFLNLMRKL